MTLYLIRGLPGSGKSTYAQKLGCFHVEADMYHVKNGEYRFKGHLVKAAHEWCFEMATLAMLRGVDVAVSNTFTRGWEMERYLEAAREAEYSVKVICMTGNWGNNHSVPESVLADMRCRFEPVSGEEIV